MYVVLTTYKGKCTNLLFSDIWLDILPIFNNIMSKNCEKFKKFKNE